MAGSATPGTLTIMLALLGQIHLPHPSLPSSMTLALAGSQATSKPAPQLCPTSRRTHLPLPQTMDCSPYAPTANLETRRASLSTALGTGS
jgi:hypothetical protein